MPNQLERIDGGETTICEPKLVGCKILEDDQPDNLPDPIDRDGDGYHDWWCPYCRDGWVLNVDNDWRCVEFHSTSTTVPDVSMEIDVLNVNQDGSHQ